MEKRGMSDGVFEQVASVADLTQGVPMDVELSNDEQVCIIKIGKDVYGISNNCPHADFPMADGEMVDDYIIECGLHGAQFDVRDGRVLELPATEPIGCYDVKIEDGAVWVRPNRS
ncbi:MAG: nitrite reductase (NAD(P)H) small subunit [Gemmatimonadales bacterium]|jgi:3-phenylpropionate/trans-cinnamate dioxygenase ferredoxin subunit